MKNEIIHEIQQRINAATINGKDEVSAAMIELLDRIKCMDVQSVRAEMLARQFRIQSSAAAILLRVVVRLSLEFDVDAKEIVSDSKCWLFNHLYSDKE